MKKLFILLAIVNTMFGFAQCTNLVQVFSGTQTINGVQVTLSNNGIASFNSYCTTASPYWIGSNGTQQGNGSYTFTFSPHVSAITLNISAIDNKFPGNEEVSLFINGSHYQVTQPGASLGACNDHWAVITPEGNIGAVYSTDALTSGWYDMTISGDIETLTVMDNLVAGVANGSVFSLRICDALFNIPDYNSEVLLKIAPNPFSQETTIKTKKTLSNATLKLYNLYGQKILELQNLFGDTINLSRDNLMSGIYLLQIEENNIIYSSNKLIIK